MKSHVVGVVCETPPEIQMAIIPLVSNSTYLSTIPLTCIKGWWFSRQIFSKTLQCSADGTWQPKYINCKGMSDNYNVKVCLTTIMQ